MNSQVRTVVIVHAAAEWATFHRGGMLAALARALPPEMALLGVNRPISPDITPWKHPRKFWSQIWRTGLTYDAHGIPVVTPRLLLHERVAGSVPLAQTANKALQRSQLKAVLKRVYPNATQVIQWIYYPTQRWVWDEFPRGGRVYECYDDYSRTPAGERDDAMWAVEQVVLQAADLVFVTAKSLQSAREKLARRIELLPNGVPDFFFEASPKANDDPVAKLPHPRIGYLGNIFSHLDFRLLEDLFTQNSSWHLVLVGPVERGAPISKLAALPNVHFLGKRPYQAVPSVLSEMDVGLIPFVVNDFTRAINPLKLYEYLAVGLPVVGTRLPELEKFGGLIRIENNDAASFGRAIEETLRADQASLQARLTAAAQPYSWTSIVREHVVPALQAIGGPQEHHR
jgi:glycosyltransferase involved in cell wall biosynthesis